MYSEPWRRAESALVLFCSEGNGAPQVGGGSVGGGVVGFSVGRTLRSGGTPAKDTFWLRPEKITTALRKKKGHSYVWDKCIRCNEAPMHQTDKRNPRWLLTYPSRSVNWMSIKVSVFWKKFTTYKQGSTSSARTLSGFLWGSTGNKYEEPAACIRIKSTKAGESLI